MQMCNSLGTWVWVEYAMNEVMVGGKGDESVWRVKGALDGGKEGVRGLERSKRGVFKIKFL